MGTSAFLAANVPPRRGRGLAVSSSSAHEQLGWGAAFAGGPARRGWAHSGAGPISSWSELEAVWVLGVAQSLLEHATANSTPELLADERYTVLAPPSVLAASSSNLGGHKVPQPSTLAVALPQVVLAAAYLPPPIHIDDVLHGCADPSSQAEPRSTGSQLPRLRRN